MCKGSPSSPCPWPWSSQISKWPVADWTVLLRSDMWLTVEQVRWNVPCSERTLVSWPHRLSQLSTLCRTSNFQTICLSNWPHQPCILHNEKMSSHLLSTSVWKTQTMISGWIRSGAQTWPYWSQSSQQINEAQTMVKPSIKLWAVKHGSPINVERLTPTHSKDGPFFAHRGKRMFHPNVAKLSLMWHILVHRVRPKPRQVP